MLMENIMHTWVEVKEGRMRRIWQKARQRSFTREEKKKVGGEQGWD